MEDYQEIPHTIFLFYLLLSNMIISILLHVSSARHCFSKKNEFQYKNITDDEK